MGMSWIFVFSGLWLMYFLGYYNGYNHSNNGDKNGDRVSINDVLQELKKEIIRDIDACERTKSTPYDVGISTGLNMALNKVIKRIEEIEG